MAKEARAQRHRHAPPHAPRTEEVEGLQLHGAVVLVQRAVDRRVLRRQAGEEEPQVRVQLPAHVHEDALALAQHALGGAHEVDRQAPDRAALREKLRVVPAPAHSR